MKQPISVRLVIGFLLSCCIITVTAQESYELQRKTHVLHDGHARQIAFGPDNEVYVAYGREGLRAFTYQDSHFVSVAHIKKEDGITYCADVATNEDGFIFSANSEDGIGVYTFNGSTFSSISHLGTTERQLHLEVDDKGYIYIIDEYELQIYEFDGASLSITATFGGYNSVAMVGSFSVRDSNIVASCSIADSGVGLVSLMFNGDSIRQKALIIDDNDANDIALGANGMIYTGDGYRSNLRAYHQDDDIITLIADKNYEYSNGGFPCHGVHVGNDSLLYVSLGDGGTHAYQFQDSTFILKRSYNEHWRYSVAAVDVELRADGTLFAACATDGILALEFQGDSVRHVASNNEGGYVYWGTNAPFQVDTNPSGLIATLNGEDGVRVYNYVNGQFRNVAHLHDSLEYQNYAADVLLTPKGDIFLRASNGTLHAYEFDNYNYTHTAEVNLGYNRGGGVFRGVEEWVDGTILVTGMGIAAYSYSDAAFSLISEIETDIVIASLTVDIQGNIFLACGEDGLKVYAFDGSTFNLLTSRNDGGTAINVSVTDDGLVLLSDWNDGLRIYNYENSTLTFKSHWEPSRGTFDAQVDSNGLIYVGYADTSGDFGGVEVLCLENDLVTRIASDTISYPVLSLALGDNGMVYTANGLRGMFAWELLNTTEVNEDRQEIPISFRLNQNYPNPFNPNTTISYELPVAVDVTLHIYDVIGREIKTLVNTHQQAGQYSTRWNGKSNSGLPVETGLYFARIQAGDNSSVIKMVYLK